MGPGALVHRISRLLEPLTADVRDAVLRALLVLYPVRALSDAERAKQYRARHATVTTMPDDASREASRDRDADATGEPSRERDAAPSRRRDAPPPPPPR